MQAQVAEPRKIRITEIGQACRHCQTPVVKQGHKKGFRFNPMKRAYWFEWWLACPQCKAIYMVDEAKRFGDNTAARKISPETPVNVPMYELTLTDSERLALLSLVTSERASARIQRHHEAFQRLTDIREKLTEPVLADTTPPWD